MRPSGFAVLSSWTTQFFEFMDHTVFCKIRQKIGEEKLVLRFSIFSKGSFRPKDTWGKSLPFVDASHLIFKANLWEERDEARKKKYDKLNHKTLPKVAYDPEARIGCKGGSKFWYGY